MVDFSKILGKQAAAIEKPKPLPVGTYIALNPKLPSFEAIGKKETPGAVFGLQIIAPTEDVDTDELKTYGDIKGKTVRHTMYLSEATEFRTKEELKNAFGVEEEDKTLGQMFNETVNKQVYVTIRHRPSDDGQEIYAEVEKLAKVD